MNKRIIAVSLALLFAICCLNVAFAEDNTTDIAETDDNANYIMPVSISKNGIEFSDGFTGFCLNQTKDSITTDDGFEKQSEANSDVENLVKLAIIECYKQNRESDFGKIIESIVSDSYDLNDEVVNEVINSNEKIGDREVVDIDNVTEATFDFEFLKSVSDEKSDCIAYTVSLKTSETDLLGSVDDNSSDEYTTANEDNDTEEVKTSTDNNTNDVKTSTDNNTEEVKTASNGDNNADNVKTNSTDDKTDKNNNNQKDDETIVNETNKTIINKTNTVTVNQNNTTIINQKTVKTINNTTKETPQNDTVQDLLKKAGNPIIILIAVIIIIAVVIVAARRKD